MVGHIAYSRLHITEYVFPDVSIFSIVSEYFNCNSYEYNEYTGF
jgi:hypothetical protein